MKDLEPPVSGRTRARAAGPRVWIKNQAVRVGLAETLCTYVMMVRGSTVLVLVLVDCDRFGPSGTPEHAAGTWGPHGGHVGATWGSHGGQGRTSSVTESWSSSGPHVERLLLPEDPP